MRDNRQEVRRIFFYADGVEVPTLGNSQPLKHVQGLRKGISGTPVFSGLEGSVWEFKSTACIDQMIQLNGENVSMRRCSLVTARRRDKTCNQDTEWSRTER